MMNQALTTLHKRELAPIQRYGDWLTQRIAQALAVRFTHRNRDGSVFTPRVLESVTFPPYYHLVILDPETLWHFSKEKMIAADTLAALTGAAQRLVRPITRIPDEAGCIRHGIAYAILLRDLPRNEEETRLPKTARLEPGMRNGRGKLDVPIGVSARGDEWRALAEIGHALIVGATGAGKSTWLHSALAALLTQNPPTDLRVALIDPKRSELTAWAHAPHLLAAIAFTPDQAEKLLTTIVAEMDRRGELLAGAMARDIRAYNARARERLPYMLVVIDECLDLVLAEGTNLARPLKTIAIRGRSAGVILWAATQHASAVVGLPRVININLATRLAFRVNDASAAQAAGCPGAQTLPRTLPGRMLAKLNTAPTLMQAYHLADEDLAAVARAISGNRVATTDAPSPFTAAERALLEWAHRENGGYLTIEDIQVRGGAGHRAARRIGEQWEARGWLERGERNRRRLTPTLLERLAE